MPYNGSIAATTPVYKNENNEPIAPPKKRNNALDMDSFLQLLAAQISHQDPMNPQGNEDYMVQMAQMSMVQAMNDMMQMSMTTYASSMLGKTVTVAEVINGKVNKIEGVVSGVSIYNGKPILHIDGKDFTLDKLMVIGKMPEKKPEKPQGTEGTEGTEGIKPDTGTSEEPEKPQGAEGAEGIKPDTDTSEKPEGTAV